MDSISGTGLDDHEGFFESYDAEQGLSLAPFELENEAPSAEQLARSARFRKPVALFVSALALFSAASLISLQKQAAQPELAAQFSAALPAASNASAASSPSSVVEAPPEPSAEVVSAVVPELTVSASDLEPETSPPEPAASAASALLAGSRATASAPPPKHSGSAAVVHRVADAQSARAPLTSSALPRVAAPSVLAAPKPVVAAPRSFNSVASFPDVQH